MKKILTIYLLFGIAILLNACSADFLEEKPKEFEAPENTFTSTRGFNAAKNGLYAYSRLEFQTWNDGIITHGACPYETLQAGTDICVTFRRDAALLTFEDYSFNPATSYIRSRWKWAYGLIANANQLINNAEHPNIDWTNANDKVYFQAQGRFFRAYAYRYLTYLFGDVPWIDKIAESYRLDFVRTPKAEVLQHMITDLEFAAEHLPEDPNKVQPGELTKWAALHLLSEIYIYAGEYKKAETAALQVINSSYHQLMKNRFGKHMDEPGDVFSDLFKENNHNRTSGNLESIWVVQAEYDKQGGGGEHNDYARRAWVPAYYNIPGFQISVAYGGRGLGQIRPLEWLLDSYAEDDIRNSGYNIRRNWYYNNPDPKFADIFGKLHTITQAEITNGNCFVSTTKFDFGVENNPTYAGASKDKTRFRLAETYLLLAEAYIRQNESPKAADAINEVRRRAKASEINAAQATLDYLLDERARELLGEEMRRFTLAHTGTIIERTSTYNPVSGTKIKDHHILWPIPQEVIDANSDVKWENNSGY